MTFPYDVLMCRQRVVLVSRSRAVTERAKHHALR
jgi:hypothetical protein